MESHGAWRRQLQSLPVALGGEGITSPVNTSELAFLGAAYAVLPAVRTRAALCTAWWDCDATTPDRLFGAACYGARQAPAGQPLLPFQSQQNDPRYNKIVSRIVAHTLRCNCD